MVLKLKVHIHMVATHKESKKSYKKAIEQIMSYDVEDDDKVFFLLIDSQHQLYLKYHNCKEVNRIVDDT